MRRTLSEDPFSMTLSLDGRNSRSTRKSGVVDAISNADALQWFRMLDDDGDGF
eukprot:SAG31_NODE_41300_length_276_cov_2.050847_1_plen_52_part_10